MNPFDVEKYLRAKYGDARFEQLYKQLCKLSGRKVSV